MLLPALAVRQHSSKQRPGRRRRLCKGREKRQNDIIEETLLGLAYSRLTTVHQKRDAESQIPFLVPLVKELLLQVSHPSQMQVPWHCQVPKVGTLQSYLQQQSGVF